MLLPKLAREKGTNEQGAAPSSSPVCATGIRVAVVDDNVDAAQMLGMFLQARGYQVTIEHDAERALALAKQTPIDVFLLDIGLPGMDGNELARRLRATPESSKALLIAITGYGNDYDMATSMRAGFDDYLVKPANPIKVVELITKCFNAGS